MIHIIRSRVTAQQVTDMLQALDTYVKLAVDVQRGILAGGGPMHADIEDVHLSTLWGHYGNISYRLGRKLFIDPKTEMFINDDEANRDLICKRPYREPWVVPEKV